MRRQKWTVCQIHMPFRLEAFLKFFSTNLTAYADACGLLSPTEVPNSQSLTEMKLPGVNVSCSTTLLRMTAPSSDPFAWRHTSFHKYIPLLSLASGILLLLLATVRRWSVQMACRLRLCGTCNTTNGIHCKIILSSSIPMLKQPPNSNFARIAKTIVNNYVHMLHATQNNLIHKGQDNDIRPSR